VLSSRPGYWAGLGLLGTPVGGFFVRPRRGIIFGDREPIFGGRGQLAAGDGANVEGVPRTIQKFEVPGRPPHTRLSESRALPRKLGAGGAWFYRSPGLGTLNVAGVFSSPRESPARPRRKTGRPPPTEIFFRFVFGGWLGRAAPNCSGWGRALFFRGAGSLPNTGRGKTPFGGGPGPHPPLTCRTVGGPAKGVFGKVAHAKGGGGGGGGGGGWDVLGRGPVAGRVGPILWDQPPPKNPGESRGGTKKTDRRKGCWGGREGIWEEPHERGPPPPHPAFFLEFRKGFPSFCRDAAGGPLGPKASNPDLCLVSVFPAAGGGRGGRGGGLGGNPGAAQTPVFGCRGQKPGKKADSSHKASAGPAGPFTHCPPIVF